MKRKKVTKASKKASRLKAASLKRVKPLRSSAAPSPLPIPYPN